MATTFPYVGIAGIERRAAEAKARLSDTNGLRYLLFGPFVYGRFTYITDGRVFVRIKLRRDIEETKHLGNVYAAGRFEGWMDRSHSITEWPAWPELPKEPDFTRCDYCVDIGEDEECPSCWGHGIYIDRSRRRINGAFVSTGYFMLIASLPCVEYGVREESGKEMVPFRFKGGVGFVMPIIAED